MPAHVTAIDSDRHPPKGASTATAGQVIMAGGADATSWVSYAGDVTGTPAASTVTGLSMAGARGAVLYRGATTWVSLAAGTAGQVLSTNGAGADPSWITMSSASSSSGTSSATYTINNAATAALSTGELMIQSGDGVSAPNDDVERAHLFHNPEGARLIYWQDRNRSGAGFVEQPAIFQIGRGLAGTNIATQFNIASGDGTDTAAMYMTMGSTGVRAYELDVTINRTSGAINPSLIWVFSGVTPSAPDPGGSASTERFGRLSTVGGAQCTAFGYNASAGNPGGSAVAIGYNAAAPTNTCVAVGSGATANNSSGDCTALGTNANVGGGFTTTVGAQAQGSGSWGVSLGASSNVAHSHSICVGFGATSTVTHQLVFGSATHEISSVYFGQGPQANAAPSAVQLNTTPASGSNVAGANFTIATGLGTGNAGAGFIYFNGSEPVGSGGGSHTPLTRVSIDGTTGDLNLSQRTNGQQLGIQSRTELVTVNAGTSVNSTITIPAGAIVLCVTAYVVTTITVAGGATTWRYGRSTDGTPNRYGSTLALASGTSSTGLDSIAGGPSNNTTSCFITIATQNGTSTFTAGAVRVTAHYFLPTAATS